MAIYRYLCNYAIFHRNYMARPKLLLDVERMKYPYTGLYYYCMQLARALQGQLGGRFDLRFLKPTRTVLPFEAPGPVLKKHHKITGIDFGPYDIYHGTWQLTKFFPRKGPTKFVLTVHDLNFLYAGKSSLRKRQLLRRIQQRVDAADAVVVISDYVRQDLEKHIRMGSTPVYRIYNGVELKEFPGFDRPSYRPQRPFLFSLGTVLPKKNFHVLPRLLPGTDYELIIGGIMPDKAYADRIREEARRLGVENRLILTGALSDEEKYWYLKHTEAFLFPSLSEGFGMPPVEAMRLGKPVFLSTYTSLPEIGGPVAYYFRSFDGDHMRQVLADGLEDYRRHRRRDEIIRWSQQFTWEHAAQRYARVYEEVLDGSALRRHPRRRPLTAVIPVKNEEAHIRDAIRSVRWADEILVIDSGSTDHTVQLARSEGARVISRPFDHFSAQKNYAIDQATHDWIFVLDADERVPDALRDEILRTLIAPSNETAFWIRRINFVGRQRIRFSGWRNDKCIRLFDRRYARYDGRYVHEEVRNNGPTGMLRHKLLHYTYRNYEQFASKLDFYARLKAREWHEKGRRPGVWKQRLSAWFRFFKHYIWHLGFLDGKAGWRIARQYMEAARKRYEYLEALQKRTK